MHLTKENDVFKARLLTLPVSSFKHKIASGINRKWTAEVEGVIFNLSSTEIKQISIWGLSRKRPAIVNIMRTVWATSMEPGSQGEWTGMSMCEQWWLHCTGQWGWEMPLSEPVYCVAITFKMTEQVEQWICIKLCIKLEHSSMETIRMIQKAAAMGNCDWQLHHDNTLTHASCLYRVFWWNIKSLRWLGSPIAQIWSPVTPGFSQN